MERQQYSNHVRYYIPHHFIFYPVTLALVAGSAWQAFVSADRSLEWMAITAAFVLVAWLSFMLRQHYALTNQDRIVRLEMRLRYYQLTQKRFEEVEAQLNFAQVKALRFASDQELIGLIRRAIEERLTADEIKKAVKDWLPDSMRV